MESLRGQLLVAGAGLIDPNFRRTVILVGEHNEEGAIGVVLNRPTSLLVPEVAPPLIDLAGPQEQVFVGGPVQPQSAVVLAEFDEPHRAHMLAFGSIGFLQGDLDVDTVRWVRRARVFAGYAGWGAGQLEAEIEESSWILEPALPEDVFTEDPEGLWSGVLRRKGSQYLILSTMPFDPSLN